MNGITYRNAILVVWLALMVALAAPAQAWFEKYQPEVVVSDPYIELRTGPGRGYPIFYVAGQGDRVQLLKRRTDWIKISVDNPRQKTGWVKMDQLSHTLDLEGNPVIVPERGIDQFEGRRWELGMSGGDFGGAASITGYLGFALTRNITLQAEGGQILGDFSDGTLFMGNIVMYPFPRSRISPFFTIGSGIVNVEPQTTIVQAEDRQDEIVHAGAGANFYLSDRFILRMEYKRHTVLTSRDDNQEIDQWKAGFSVFF